jgi:uncharacterized protein YbcI
MANIEGRQGTENLDHLADELLAIHDHACGSSAESVEIHQADGFLVAFLDGLELQKAEQLMIEHGDAESVLRVRSLLQRQMAPTFRAAVERATGRKVASFASTTALDNPPYCVEIFRLDTR